MRNLSILCVPVGSEGDVRPLLWLAAGLAARGHTISFLITPYYRHLVDERRWRVIEFGGREEFVTAMRDPRLWSPRRGSEFILDTVFKTLKRSREILDSEDTRYDLVIGGTLATGAFSWAEKNKVPRLMLHMQPMCLRSADDCPLFLEGWEWLCRAPRFVKRAVFALSDKIVARAVFPAVNAHRASLGLPPIRRVYEQLWNGADGVAALFPDWYAPPQREWPGNVRQFGFPLEAATNTELPAPVRAFLASGLPPIVWTHGSANIDTEKFSAVAREATRLLGARGLWVRPAAAGAPSDDTFLASGLVPFPQLMPHCRAIVHHGGIGTSARALEAGLPQLVIPRAHDQPDNARRLTRLGVAARLRYRDLNAESAARALRTLLDNPVTAANCARLREKVQSANPLPALCDWAESLANRRQTQHA